MAQWRDDETHGEVGMDDVTSPRVTQRVPVDGLADLDTRPRRAALAFVDGRGPVGTPALVRHVDGQLLVGVARAEVPSGPPPRINRNSDQPEIRSCQTTTEILYSHPFSPKATGR